MKLFKTLAILAIVLLAAGIASADLKVVKMTHKDGFSMMGQTQPPEDTEQITWIGEDRLHMDQGATATIIRLDLNKLFVINHNDQSYNVLDLPVTLDDFMPPGMAEQMKMMMTFEVTVTPVDETKVIGEWEAKRFDMKMTSKMMTMDAVIWSVDHPDLDMDAFYSMYEHMASMQPGMAAAAKEMRKINGLVIEQQSEMKMPMMGDISVKTSEKTTSITKIDAPEGTYDPPAEYTEKPFDLMASMQR